MASTPEAIEEYRQRVLFTESIYEDIVEKISKYPASIQLDILQDLNLMTENLLSDVTIKAEQENEHEDI